MNNYSNEQLIKLYKDENDEYYFELLLDQNKGLIVNTLKKYGLNYTSFSSNDRDNEAFLEANKTFLTAVKKYDETKGALFSTFLVNNLEYAMKNLLNNDHTISVSSKDWAFAQKIRKLENNYYADYGEYPTIEELVSIIDNDDISEIDIINAKQLLQSPEYLDACVDDDSDVSVSNKYGENDSYSKELDDTSEMDAINAKLTGDRYDYYVILAPLSGKDRSDMVKQLAKKRNTTTIRINQIFREAKAKVKFYYKSKQKAN